MGLHKFGFIIIIEDEFSYNSETAQMSPIELMIGQTTRKLPERNSQYVNASSWNRFSWLTKEGSILLLSTLPLQLQGGNTDHGFQENRKKQK